MVSTLQLLKTRKSQGSTPASRTDPYQLWVTFESGGMAGCNGAAIIALLEECGYAPTLFDGMMGCSAGGHIMAHFAAGSARAGSTIFPRDLAHKRFINPLRLGWGHAMDIRHLIRRYATPNGDWFLDADKLSQAPQPLYVLASTQAGQAVWLPLNNQPASQVYQLCYITAGMPVASHPWHRIPHLLDGALSGCAVPWPDAGIEPIPHPPTHWLVVRNRPPSYWEYKTSRQEKVLATLSYALNPRIANAMRHRIPRINTGLATIRGFGEQQPSRLLVLGAATSDIGSATTNAHQIWRAMVQTYRQMATVLEEDAPLPRIWQEHLPSDIA